MPNAKVLNEKAAVVAALEERIKNAQAGVLVDYRGITVAEDTELRNELRKNGVEITREVYEPLVSFMGDCLGESLLDNSRVFQSKVLITECTFLDDGEEAMSKKKGHSHLKDIVHALNELDDEIKCEKIILSHFSYSICCLYMIF